MDTLAPNPTATARPCALDAPDDDQRFRVAADKPEDNIQLGCGAFSPAGDDATEFARLPQVVRDEVSILIRVMQAIGRAITIQRGCKQQAALFHGERGFAVQSLRRKFDAWVAGDRHWKSLIDRAKAGPEFYGASGDEGRGASLPGEFVEFWRGLCERNQRKCKPAYRALLRRWQQWRRQGGALDPYIAIPGYKECPSAEFTGYPRGWAYRNLMRHKPTRFELTAARIGRSAAAAHRPLVFTSRVGLRVGQYYLFDDLWHDFKVNVVGQRHSSRLLQLHALDLFSGCNFARGLKPVVENEVTGVQERLKEAEMVFLLAHVLGSFGYLADDTGTTLVVEHGTAAIREDIERRLHDLTGGRIKVERSGIEGVASFAGQYAGRSKGNFRFKAALESLGNLIHNETADTLLIPGQVGSNSRLNAPEELAGRDRENDALLRAMAAMEPERASLLRLPFLELNQASRLVTEIHERINARTEHALEGWVDAGLVAQEFRLAADQPWMPTARLMALPEDRRRGIEALIESGDGTDCGARVRKLAPIEVWQGGRKQLTRMAGHQVALLLGMERSRPVTVDSGLIEFQDREIAPEPMRYDPVIRGGALDPHSTSAGQRIRDGERFDAVVNPFDPEALHLFDGRGRYVGTVGRYHKYCRADVDALQHAMGRAAKIQAELLRPVAMRGAEVTRQRIADAKHNAAVLGGRPMTPADRDRARAMKAHEGSTEDFLAQGGALDPNLQAPVEEEFTAEGLL